MWSQVRGPDTALIEDTIGVVLERTVRRHPTGEALVSRHQEIRWTWEELHSRVEAAAGGLAALGLSPGDRIGIWASNCAEWLLLQLAAARNGLVLVNVNPAYRSHELRFVLAKSRMRALVMRRRDARADYGSLLEEACQGAHLPLEHVVFLGSDVPAGGVGWNELAALGAPAPPAASDARAVVNIQYTSGTTGSPKGVLLTHRNLVNNAALIGQRLRTTALDRLCMPVPMYHCFGCVMASLQCVVTGACLIMPAPQFDVRATLEAIHAERATILFGVPTMFIAALEHPEFDRFDLTSLRTGIMAGASCPIQVMKAVVERMHCRDMTIAYGQTESSPVITMSQVGDALDLRVSTVGTVMPATEVKIVAQDTGQTVAVGQQGELCTRGYLVMRGYDDEPEATAKTIDAEGWLHTGDLAVLRPDGYFRITGRAKEMLIRGGENIYPREIEEFLHLHPKIADVQVVGIPDRRLGEVPVAWIRLRAGQTADEHEIRQYCQGRIAHFKIPQYIRFVDEFPMTVTGKVQKFKMRQREIEERGLADAAREETA